MLRRRYVQAFGALIAATCIVSYGLVASNFNEAALSGGFRPWVGWSQTGTGVFRPDLNVTVSEVYNALALEPNDVIMCVPASLDKVDTLVRVIGAWDGPFVVAVFARAGEGGRTALESASPLFRRDGGANGAVVFVEGASKDAFYPINAMRNFATSLVPNDRGYGVLVMDADMILSTGAYGRLRSINEGLGRGDENKTFVIPCFEFGKDSYDMSVDVSQIPRTKEELLVTTRLNLTRQSKFTYYQQGHSCTEYERWLYGHDTAPWAQSTYHTEYEPFMLVRQTSRLPTFDERFVYWGNNKQIRTWIMFAMGYRFWTVPNVFAVHYPHVSLAKPREWIGNSTEKAAARDQWTRNRERYFQRRAEIGVAYNIDPDKYHFRHVGFPKWNAPPVATPRARRRRFLASPQPGDRQQRRGSVTG